MCYIYDLKCKSKSTKKAAQCFVNTQCFSCLCSDLRLFSPVQFTPKQMSQTATYTRASFRISTNCGRSFSAGKQTWRACSRGQTSQHWASWLSIGMFRITEQSRGSGEVWQNQLLLSQLHSAFCTLITNRLYYYPRTENGLNRNSIIP